MFSLRRNALASWAAAALLGSFLTACGDVTPTASEPRIGALPTSVCWVQDGETVCMAPLGLGPMFGSPGAPMVFTDEAAFESFIAERVDLSKTDLEQAEQLNGYPTLRAYLDGDEDTEESAQAAAGSDGPTGNEAMALEIDGVTREDFVFGDALLSVLNERGEVQIGGRIFKVTRDTVYEVAPEDLALLNEKVPTLSSPAPAVADARIGVHPVETTETEVIEGPATSRLPAVRGGPRFNVNYVPSGSYRLLGNSYVTNLWFYSEAGVLTAWQRRKHILFFYYWANTWQPGTLSHTYNVTFQVGLNPSINYPVSGTQTSLPGGIPMIQRTLMWRVGISPSSTSIKGNGNTTHTVGNPTLNASVGTHF
jgi:hypothetical protein